MTKEEEHLKIYKQFCLGDLEALGLLYQHFWPPPGGKGENLVKWAMRKYNLKQCDAEDVVSDFWQAVLENKPKIQINLRAFVCKSIANRIFNLMKKRNPGEKP